MNTYKRKIVLSLNSINQIIFKRNVNASDSVNMYKPEPKSFEEIPTPPSLPFIGQRHHFLPGQMLSDLKSMHQTLYKRYGPISKLNLAGKTMVMLYDPEAAATIYRGENLSPETERPGLASIVYYRRFYNKTPEQSNEITGLVSDTGENWRKLRSIVNPVMLHKNIVQRYSTQIEDVAKDMVARMRKLRDDNNKLNENFASEMNLWALESIGVVALGGRLNCLTQDLPDSSPQKRVIQCVHEIFRIIHELEFKPSLWKCFSSKKFKQAMKIYEEQDELTRYFVQKYRKELESKIKQDNEEKGVLEKLLDIDENIAVIMAKDMLFGGVDTTANSISATFYLLATNQDKQDKLREAIANGDRKYLRACYKESLRLVTISGNMRETSKEHIILGYKIPKHTVIVFGHQLMSLRADQFPRPNEYIPERWIEVGPLSHKNAHPFAFNPFGFGVRMCPGVRIAELEVETFLTEAIKNFKVEWSGPPPEVAAGLINSVKGPFNFTFKDV